ncbi:hypothetical protein [Streptomyces justiciae]|uniref:Uncharacterized protein n=1 Tax=Streptomyces justiciae TaxID=2780140 RepID=A0ABU3M6V8_9ACTN|nr:hypothetical protein [Streptomyces justiciae]MDT7847250.1 hypothetical protein [Streptomyces justiciae]
MSAASAADWLTCAGIGMGTGVVALGLLKAALDGDHPQTTAPRLPGYLPPPALPARAPRLRARHAAPPLIDETQPIHCVQPSRARHARKAA